MVMQMILVPFRRKLYTLFVVIVVFFFPVLDFEDCIINSTVPGEIHFCLYISLTHDMLSTEIWKCLIDFSIGIEKSVFVISIV